MLAIQEYHPDVHEVLVEVLGLPLTYAELEIVTMFRMASLRGEIEVEGPFKAALERAPTNPSRRTDAALASTQEKRPHPMSG